MRTLVLLLLLAAPLWAEDWTVAGKDYHNVVVGTVEADRVHITFDGGIGTVMLADLTPELQKRFGFDAKKAKDEMLAEEQKQEKLDGDPVVQAQRAAIKASQIRYVEVNQVLPDGLLVTPLLEVFNANYRLADRMVFIHSKFNNIVDGDRIAVRVYVSGTYSYQSALGPNRTVVEWTAVAPLATDFYMVWGQNNYMVWVQDNKISLSDPVAP